MAERKPAQKKAGKTDQGEKMNPKIQDNGPTRLKRNATQLRGRGGVPGTVQPRRINRTRVS